MIYPFIPNESVKEFFGVDLVSYEICQFCEINGTSKNGELRFMFIIIFFRNFQCIYIVYFHDLCMKYYFETYLMVFPYYHSRNIISGLFYCYYILSMYNPALIIIFILYIIQILQRLIKIKRYEIYIWLIHMHCQTRKLMVVKIDVC